MADFTVGDLRRELNGLPDNTKLYFEGGVTFSRLKRWDDDEFIICFSEVQAELSPPFKKKHPKIIVAFARLDDNGEKVHVAYIPRL